MDSLRQQAILEDLSGLHIFTHSVYYIRPQAVYFWGVFLPCIVDSQLQGINILWADKCSLLELGC